MSWKIVSSSPEIAVKLSKDFHLYKQSISGADQSLTLLLSGIDQKKKSDISLKGEVTVRRNYKKKSAIIFCEDSDRLHEVAYLYILSVLGKYLDTLGFHRIHASAVGVEDNAFLFVGASGMGKSHLSYLLPMESLADDMIFINKEGVCLPMLHRRGFNKSVSKEISLENSYSLQRLEYGEKVLSPITSMCSYPSYKLKALYFLKEGDWIGLRKSSFFMRLKYLFTYVFIGIGTPQMFKFFWEPGLKDFFVKFKITYSRFVTMLKLCFFAKGFTLTTNKSSEVVKFMECQLFESKPEHKTRSMVTLKGH